MQRQIQITLTRDAKRPVTAQFGASYQGQQEWGKNSAEALIGLCSTHPNLFTIEEGEGEERTSKAGT